MSSSKIKLLKTSSSLNNTCRAENAAGMSTHSAELTVNGIFTGRTEILYLQRSLRLFLLTLVESLWMKESLWWLCTILEEETGPMLSPGISRGTPSTQTLIWSDHHTTMLGTQSSLLTINDVGFRHSGTYTCRAESYAGVSLYSA